MSERVVWSIRREDLVDNYKQPDRFGDVVRKMDGAKHEWHLFHPSEADPNAGFRLHPYAIDFCLDAQPCTAHLLRIQYLTIAPRLAHLEIRINGAAGLAYLHPSPSLSKEIRVPDGLGTSIYSEGTAEVIIPQALLRRGQNRLELIAHDGGQVIRTTNPQKIGRLDRLATGAGVIYQSIEFSELSAEPAQPIQNLELRPLVLYRRNDECDLVERCRLFLGFSGCVQATTMSLELRGDGRTEQLEIKIPTLNFGHFQQDFDLFDGDGEVEYSIRGEVNGQDFARTGTIARRRKWKVYVTSQVHTDIGYTHRQWEVAERLCRNIDKALDMIEAGDPTLVYHLDSAWALERYLATRGARRQQQLAEQIRAGRIAIPANYVDLLTQYAALEDLIRNGEFTESFLRPLGLRSDLMTVVDIASLSGSLPPLLQNAGVKYLVHANNLGHGPFRLFNGRHRRSPFYWQGPSGGRILTWLAKMYCELRKVCGSPPVLSAAERGLELWLDEYEHADYAPDAVLLYGQEADNTDLDPQPLDFVRQWNETYAYPRLIPCGVSEFFQYVESHFAERLTTVMGDEGAYWEDGVASSIVPTMEVRRAQAMLPAAERLEALAVLYGDDWSFPQANFDEAWRSILLYDEHTWGAFLSCREPGALLQKDQWAVKEHFAHDAGQWAGRLLHSAATRHSLSWNTDGREVAVYNPHSWKFGGPVTVEIGATECVFDPESGQEIPTRVVSKTQSQAVVELWLEPLEGLSYRRLTLREDQWRIPNGLFSRSALAPELIFENEHYRLVLNTHRACVTSWIDKALDRELVDTKDCWGLGQFLYAEGGDEERLSDYRFNPPIQDLEILDGFELLDGRVETNELGTNLTLKGKVAYGELEVEWRLFNGARRVDVRFTYGKQEREAKEAVYIAFPLSLPKAEVSSDSQLGWVNWARDEMPGGCKEWLPLQTGILVSHPEAEVFIASPDIPLFCIGDIVRGHWPTELDLSGGRILSYALNNYWFTNYKASQGGDITFSYRLTSDRVIARDRAFRFGWQARLPLYAQRISLQEFRNVQPPYDQLAGGVLARVTPEQVVVSTLKKARWADGLIIRLQEIAGAEQTARISFPGKAIRHAWLADSLERETRELEVEPDGTLKVQVPAWGLHTVRISF